MEVATQEKWDVVVVGCGYAGAMAAIAAYDTGARVVVIEKMPDPGGISVCSAGGLRVTSDAGEALKYLVASNRGTTPDDVLKVLADGMADLAAKVEKLANAAGGVVETRPSYGNYPFPGYKSFGFAAVTALPEFGEPPKTTSIRGAEDGLRLFRVLQHGLKQRGIEVRANTRAIDLITDGQNQVTGIVVEHNGNQQKLLARGGIVLACGGFEANEDMQRQYWNGLSVRSAAFLGNTGDGIKMAQGIGADLWHMWHYHGSYGFHHTDPAYPFAIRTKRYPDWLPGKSPGADVHMPWILLDQNGRRFMNEYEPYLQDTGARAFHYFDPLIQDFPRIPAWFIADENGRKRTPFGRPTYHGEGFDFEWSSDNLDEVGHGMLQKADDIDALATILKIESSELAATLASWNLMCREGEDRDFARPPTSMMMIDQPPFYVGRIWPLVNNTQGGPVHDAGQRIINTKGRAIGGLYAAGEMGSAFGFLYMSGGNLAECFIGGEIAGQNAARRAIEGADQ